MPMSTLPLQFIVSSGAHAVPVLQASRLSPSRLRRSAGTALSKAKTPRDPLTVSEAGASATADPADVKGAAADEGRLVGEALSLVGSEPPGSWTQA